MRFKKIKTPKKCKVFMWPGKAFKKENPYTYLLSNAIERSGANVADFSLRNLIGISRVDILHIHWPDAAIKDSLNQSLFNLIKLIFCLFIMRLRRAKLVWTAHNLQSHNRNWPRIEKLLWLFFIRQTSGIIFLSRTSQYLSYEKFSELKEKKYLITPHGLYDNGENLHQLDSNNSLSNAASKFKGRVFCYFGSITPYKNVLILIREFKKVSTPSDLLIIIGKPSDNNMRSKVKESIDGHENILCKMERFTDSELFQILQISDAVILPYTNILNSGSVFLSLSFHCPVICPAVGSLPEVSREVPNWIYTYTGEFTASVITEFQLQDKKNRKSDFPNSWNWEKIGENHLNFYKTVIV